VTNLKGGKVNLSRDKTTQLIFQDIINVKLEPLCLVINILYSLPLNCLI